MQPISTFTGLVAPLDRVNVDTDQMMPKQFLKLLTRTGYGKFLFFDWRYLPGDAAHPSPNPEFVLNQARYKGATILLARANFGCGSSREHAPWGLLDYGFRVIIAPSFADIFLNNCLKNGILTITLPEVAIDELFSRTEANPGYMLTADLPKQTVSDDQGLIYHFEEDEFRKTVLLEGLDDIGMTLKQEPLITTYEKSHHPSATMYEPVDATPSATQPT